MNKRRVVIILLTLILLLFMSCLPGCKTGPVPVTEWQVTVLSVEKETGSLWSSPLSSTHIEPKAGYLFLLVEIEFKKTHPEYKLDSNWVSLSDDTGNLHEAVAFKDEFGVGFTVSSRLTSSAWNVTPPWTTNETFVYSVPSDATGFKLCFLDYPPIDLGL